MRKAIARLGIVTAAAVAVIAPAGAAYCGDISAIGSRRTS